MSHKSSIAASQSSKFQLIFDTALKAYEKETKKSLRSEPLFAELQGCHSADAILSVLQCQFKDLKRSPIGDEGSPQWLNVTVNVLLPFSDTFGEAFSPAKAIFTGIAIVLKVSIFYFLMRSSFY